MANNQIDWTNRTFTNDRDLFRKEVITAFLDERPGTGKGEETSKYEYTIKVVNNHRIFLKRPAQFNNGFDFTLHVEGINFNPHGRATSRPTHENILTDLAEKKAASAEQYGNLLHEIENLFTCSPLTGYTFNFQIGLPIEILLECIKWLFIEQDITYWNYSGRSMLYQAILKV